MTTDLFQIAGQPLAMTPEQKRSVKRGKHYVEPRGYAWAPGTGPRDQTCATCKHLTHNQRAKSYIKCGHEKAPPWTGGRGTDILASAPSCKFWEPHHAVPMRIQRKRVKGFRLPPFTKICQRPGRFGNPCRVGMVKGYTAADAVVDFERWLDRVLAYQTFENAFGPPPTQAEIDTLRGYHLACTCPLCEKHKDGKPVGVKCTDCAPCHVDVLLERTYFSQGIEAAEEE